MINEKEEKTAMFIEQVLKAVCPYDQGNLFDSIRRVYDEDKIYVAIGGEIAPYAVTTNVRWQKGTNPNENWVENALKEIVNPIKQIFRGEISEEEYEEMMYKYEDKIQKRYSDMLDKKQEELEALGG